MRHFVESLRRLYLNQIVTKEKICDLYKSGRITQEEKDYIIQS